jgi:hypothetical protein
VLVDEHSELGQEARLEGRHHEQGLAGEPRKERIANESVTEVRRQQAQRSLKFLQPQRLPQTRPAGQQRTMGMHHALGISRRPRGEEDQRLVVELEVGRAAALARGRYGADGRRDDAGDAHRGEISGGGRIDRRVPERDARFRRAHEVDDLERRQRRIERNSRGAQIPDREKVGEEFEAITVVDEHPVARTNALAAIERHPLQDFR